MGWKAILRRHSVFVEDPQAPERLELGVIIGGEGESVIRVEPSMISVAPLVAAAWDNLCFGKFGHSGCCYFSCT